MSIAAVHTGLTPAVLEYKPSDPLVPERETQPDRATFADPEKRSLFSAATKVDKLTPWIGTELHGVQLSKLTDSQKDELALLVSERGVVFFRDQDFSMEQQYDLTNYYGIQDRDTNQQDPKHVTIMGRDNDRAYGSFGSDYHNDHSFEINPPAYTMLRMVKTAPTGGDTLFASQTALFDKLSPSFQNFLKGLHAVHSSEAPYVWTINAGGKVFRPPVRRNHPLVRTHPVTKVQSLFYNPTAVLHIDELKGLEGEHVLGFLRNHVHSADDLTVRWRWQPNSVAFWDNRSVIHSAVPGGYDKSLREGKRTAIFGEKPVYDPAGLTWSERFSTDDEKANGVNGVNGEKGVLSDEHAQ